MEVEVVGGYLHTQSGLALTEKTVKLGYIPVGPKRHAWICAGPQRSFDRFPVTPSKCVRSIRLAASLPCHTHLRAFLLSFSFSRPGLSISSSGTAANILVVERLTRKQESVKRWPVLTRPRQADKGIDVRTLTGFSKVRRSHNLTTQVVRMVVVGPSPFAAPARTDTFAACGFLGMISRSSLWASP
jgi:hypothetical protein